MDNKTKHLYEFGGFRLDEQERLLLRAGESISLTPKAFDLLLVLVKRHKQLVEKEELFKAVWPDSFVEESNLSSNIALIRKALSEGENGQPYIETVPKRGYRFVAKVREVLPPLEPLPANDDGLFSPQTESAAADSVLTISVPVSKPISSRRRAAVLLTSLMLIGVIVWAVWWFALRPSPTLPFLKISPFTTFPGREGRPSFSPDGNQIAFVWDGDSRDNQDIYVKLIGAETLLRLTTDPAVDTDPAWSPDGRSVAFLRQATGRSGFYVVPAIGGSERKLAEAFLEPSNLFYRRLSYSQDSKFLAVADKSSAEEPFSIFLLSTETGERQRLTSPPESYSGDRNPAFSPDGKWIAINRSSVPGVSDIYLVPAVGGEPVRLTFDNVLVHDITWTSDGRDIIFMSLRTGSLGLWRISARGGTPERLMGVERKAYNVAIARQGNRLAYMETSADSNIWRLEIPETPGRNHSPMKLIASTVEDHSPQYSPDGKWVVFASARSGNFEIWLCDSEGNHPVQLTNFDGPITGTPRWSPDGRFIAFDSRPEGNADIFVMSPENRQPRRLTTENSADVRPSWSHNGQWIYFSSNRNGSSQIWKMAATGGPAVQVTKQGGFEGFESTNGKYFYYTKGSNLPGLWRVPTEGGEETLVLDTHQAGYWRYWAVVEQGIYFATAEKSAQPLIEFFNFTTGRIIPIAKLDKPIADNTPGLDVSLDGRFLIWSQLDQEGSDIMLMENFR